MTQRENVKELPGYGTWMSIRTRCYNKRNKDYKYYGARGVQCLLTYEEFCEIYFRPSVCSFCGISFNLAKRTIDRIDNSGHYDFSNCQVLCQGCNSSKVRKQEVGKFIGNNAWNRKLTQKEVDRIRRLYKRLKGKGRIPLQKILADKFGVSQACVSRVILKKGWSKQ